ncbi:M15 family metallopeptidase [Cellulomonas sp. SG140]|uniref:M15 family metallopeptidase n=1 Tax=Cellulomonas sp. SG140 TaxID=2976536 RepID=UPI0021E7FACC|nr:M15 family metallopeptidase [Cellulomonas sp. SG140]
MSDDASQVSGLTAQAAQAAAQSLTDHSRAQLEQVVAAARAVLDGSAGHVADDAVRTALAAALSEADQALAGTVAPARAATLGASVSTAAAQVAQAQQAWQAAQTAAAQAAAQAAVRARAAASPTPTSSVDPCRTTYTGPPFWTSVPTATGDGSNGNLPASSMTALSWTTDSHGTRFYLLTPAAQALEKLNVAFRAAFGHNLDIDLAYRDYATQVAMRAALGTVAAVPGTSPHGYGKAIDVPELPCEYGWSSVQRAWLLAHGPSFGWVQPAWALQNGSGPEYWHYEYTG